MVNNGVEYGMRRTRKGSRSWRRSQYDFDLRAISSLWNQSSVVRSWLLELAENAFEQDRRIGMSFAHAKKPVRERLMMAGWSENVGDDILYPTVRDALRAVGMLDEGSRRTFQGEDAPEARE